MEKESKEEKIKKFLMFRGKEEIEAEMSNAPSCFQCVLRRSGRTSE